MLHKIHWPKVKYGNHWLNSLLKRDVLKLVIFCKSTSEYTKANKANKGILFIYLHLTSAKITVLYKRPVGTMDIVATNCGNILSL